ncbi:hypothetical protein OG455_10740 [Kitasatospora sp. NBC_01287]|uniref:hypothetical protein n=1 Tax=Kitasatospora sp. NBC_01287 TaxID=2903573 RepID=UPI0022527219|nr:hypothetical protein [Kitasatospora sp. NBC_01287]MCX4745994.1 hypothetical protein [Kitasatospora sp. NBC_01287]
MRPSYDGEHPVAPTPTPIYDELYSEYRRLFRALPGDRAGEEDLRFTGFAVRERPYGGSGGDYREPYGALPQHQSFLTYPGQLPGVPQFVPAQQQAAQGQAAQAQAQAHAAHGQAAQHPFQSAGYHQQQPQQQPTNGQGWVAAGYLAPVTLPAPAAPAPGVPAAAPGRHRGNLLSLPPGRG